VESWDFRPSKRRLDTTTNRPLASLCTMHGRNGARMRFGYQNQDKCLWRLSRWRGLGLTGCMIVVSLLCVGCVPKGTKNPDAKRDFLGEFERLKTSTRGQCAWSKGLATLASSKVDELFYISEDFRPGRVRWRRFRKALSECWKSDLESPMGVEPIDVSGLAAHYDDDGLSDHKELLAATIRLIESYSECGPLNADEMSGFDGRGVSDEGRAWARDRMMIMNEIRVIVRGELARRSESIDSMMEGVRTESATLSEKVDEVSKTLESDYSATTLEKEHVRNQSTTIRSRLAALNDLLVRCEQEVRASTTDLSTFDQVIEGAIRRIGRRR